MRSKVTVFALILLLPAALAQDLSETELGLFNPEASTPTTMFFHFDGRQDMPINTQAPATDYRARGASSLMDSSATCLPDEPVPPLVAGDKHTQYGYSSPGYVEYDDLSDGGYPRHHPERGISYDVELDTAVVPVFTWFIELHWAPLAPGGADPDQVPLLLPNVVLQATVRQGDEISPGHAAFNQGTLIAQGRSDPAMLGPVDDTGSPHVTYLGDNGEGNGHHVYKFEFPLQYDGVDVIPKDEAFNVRLDLWTDLDGLCGGPDHPENEYIMPDWVTDYTGPGARPKFTWSIFNPLRIEMFHPQLVGDEMVIHSAVNSPWGNYDVAEQTEAVTFDIKGPSTALDVQRVTAVKTREHNHHTEAALFSFVWPHRAQNAQDGLYVASLEITNDQESAVARAAGAFRIGDGAETCGVQDGDAEVICEAAADGEHPVQESPGVGSALFVAGLTFLAFIRRR